VVWPTLLLVIKPNLASTPKFIGVLKSETKSENDGRGNNP